MAAVAGSERSRGVRNTRQLQRRSAARDKARRRRSNVTNCAVRRMECASGILFGDFSKEKVSDRI